MKQIGIWLDKQEALGVILEDGKEKSIFTIPSELDFFNPKGGSRSKTRWGPQDVVQDSKYLETEKHQLKRYFAKIAQELVDADQLALFGPAEAPDKFMRELESNYPQLANKVKLKEKTDSMTQNQFKALVKRSFNVDDRYQ
ncbi:hypothetical protein [Flagellimonas nanhaiensis]|uniref:Host attachment protein n=1 Tax=Flagellimonas nanhaiensis TaxID=2292706 RepID=A0A371JLV8_9FLAO|nr:hypothetical protein [Allomuricauda nanhaiensis]RDY58044.1 hypothetical protein DX873_16065 [Allomuricauda nanhaiensis]